MANIIRIGGGGGGEEKQAQAATLGGTKTDYVFNFTDLPFYPRAIFFCGSTGSTAIKGAGTWLITRGTSNTSATITTVKSAGGGGNFTSVSSVAWTDNSVRCTVGGTTWMSNTGFGGAIVYGEG